MFNKIMAWVWLVIYIIATIGWLSTPYEETWVFVLAVFGGTVYLLVKYIETLSKK